MTEQQQAQEHLRVIRTLMERATIYRAISAPTALLGGSLATITAAATLIWLRNNPDRLLPPFAFLQMWVLLLTITLAANAVFIWNGARKRSEPWISSGMKLALSALLPSLLATLVITIVFAQSGGAEWTISCLWSLLYGIALLSTAHFAPRSIGFLGWACFAVGVASLLLLGFGDFSQDLSRQQQVGGTLTMFVAFGLFQLIYAACTWPRRRDSNP